MSVSCTTRLAVALLPVTWPLAVAAGTFRISPVQVQVERGERSAVVKILNEGSEPATLQADGRAWTQDAGGADVYEPSNELLVFPRMVRIAPGAEQVIRLGFDGRGAPQERAFRLFLRELPVAAPGEVAVKLYLNFVVPVFVRPAKEKVAWSISSATLSGGRLTVKVANAGNAHLSISRVVATGLDGATELFSKELQGAYALAGSTRQFRAELPAEACQRVRTLRLEAISGKARRTLQLEVAPAMCGPARPPVSRTL